jgi:hypothetical protein
MRQVSQPRLRKEADAGRLGDRIQGYAVYGALALIAAIVFGTFSTHPF